MPRSRRQGTIRSHTDEAVIAHLTVSASSVSAPAMLGKAGTAAIHRIIMPVVITMAAYQSALTRSRLPNELATKVFRGVRKGQHRHEHEAPNDLDGDIVATDLRRANRVHDPDTIMTKYATLRMRLSARRCPQAHPQVFPRWRQTTDGITAVLPAADALGVRQEHQPDHEQRDAGQQREPSTPLTTPVLEREPVTAEEQAVKGECGSAILTSAMIPTSHRKPRDSNNTTMASSSAVR